MPSYDYNCKACENSFTVRKSMTDDTQPLCPKCNSSSVIRVWGGFLIGGTPSDSGSSSGCGSCTSSNCSTCKC